MPRLRRARRASPNNALDDRRATGDFEPVAVGALRRHDRADGRAQRRARRPRPRRRCSARFPADRGRLRRPRAGRRRPDLERAAEHRALRRSPCKVVATSTGAGSRCTGEDRRQLLPAPRPGHARPASRSELGSDGESSPAFADLDGDNRNELDPRRTPTASSTPIAPRRQRAAGLAGARPTPAAASGGRAFTSGAVSTDYGGAVLASLAVGDLDRDGTPEVVGGRPRGQGLRLERARVTARSHARGRTRAYSGKPLQPFVERPPGRREPHPARLPRLAGARRPRRQRRRQARDRRCARMDRHVYAWHDDGTPVAGFPVLVVDPTKVAAVDPATHAVTFKPERSATTLNQGAIVDTPAVGDLTGDGAARDRRRHQRGVPPSGRATARLQRRAAQHAPRSSALGPGRPARARQRPRCTRSKPSGDPDGDLLTGDSPFVRGWPVKVGLLHRRAAAGGRRGHHRLAGDRPGRLPERRRRRRRSA